MGKFRLALSAVSAFALATPPIDAAWAQTEKRIALIIGNAAYVHVPRLANPANDARLIAETLRGLGFALVGGGAQLDLDKAGFDRVVQGFGAQLLGADVGLFYYAGHGVQVKGANYLVPIGANPARETDVDFQMLDTNLVLRQMEGSGTRLNLVILDACRNNPFGGRGLRATAPGLAQMQAPEGTLISFATQPGNVALDGATNSPFTRALADTIRKPGLGLFDAFNEVGLAVKQATGGSQQPWLSSSPIGGSFHFAGRAAAEATPPVPRPDPCAAAGEHWRSAEAIGTKAAFEDHLSRFPDCAFASLARARIEALSRLAAVPPPAPPAVPPGTSPTPAVGTFSPATGVKPMSPERERALKPSDRFKECDVCPEMVVVPAGSFTMGSPDGEIGREQFHEEQRGVTIARQFAVGRFALTFDEWDACAAERGCNGYRPDDRGWGRGRRPVINVSWNDAKAYVAWLSRKTGRRYRLLSEAEREYITRAGTTTPFWFGSSISTRQANYNGNISYDNGPKGEHRQQTEPVDSFEPNPWGLYQVHGNVYDWVEDCRIDSVDQRLPSDGSAFTLRHCRQHVLRGGSWSTGPHTLRSAARIVVGSDVRYVAYGFRIARSPSP